MNAPVVDLEVVEQFLNTLDERTFSRHGEQHLRRDALTSPEDLSTWLTDRDLAGDPVRPADVTTARALRSALREALLGGEPALDRFPLRLVADPSGGLRVAARTGVDGLDTLVETVAVSVASGRWSRLKLCASEDCRWAFYDTSRNGGGRWCSMEVCGNRHKTRTYRRTRG